MEDDRDLTEHREDGKQLEEKIAALAELVRNAGHFVVYTGAGISTAAKIPGIDLSTSLSQTLEAQKGFGL